MKLKRVDYGPRRGRIDSHGVAGEKCMYILKKTLSPAANGTGYDENGKSLKPATQ
jgi:hypothetical protein